MDKFALFTAVLAVAASALVQIFTDPRITGQFVAKSLLALAVYALHIAIGLLVVVFLLPHGPDAAMGVTTAVLGWIGLGALDLIRFAPRLREPPAILLRFGLGDAVCLLVIATGVLSAFGIFG